MAIIFGSVLKTGSPKLRENERLGQGPLPQRRSLQALGGQPQPPTQGAHEERPPLWPLSAHAVLPGKAPIPVTQPQGSPEDTGACRDQAALDQGPKTRTPL